MNRLAVIEEHVIEDKRLGRHVEHDERSRNFAYEVTIDPSLLKKVHHRHYGGVLDQGQLGSCTGNAAAQCYNTSPLHKSGTTLKEANALALYALATRLDGIDGQYPPDDTGSSGLAAAKAAKQKGYISVYKHAFGIASALTALQKYPVITGVAWYEGFDDPDPDTGLVKIAGQVRGGHEFCVLGYEPHATLDESLVVAINSWGPGWGLNGRFKFTVKMWRALLADSGDVTILM